MSRWAPLALGLLGACGLLSACGFHARQDLGPDVHSLGIAVFANDSLEPDLERALQAELTRAARRMVTARLLAPSAADLRLEGRILEYRTRGGVRGENNTLLERGVSIRVQASLITAEGELAAGPVELGQTSGFTTREPDGLRSAEQRVLGNLAEGLLLELLVALDAMAARTAVPGAPEGL